MFIEIVLVSLLSNTHVKCTGICPHGKSIIKSCSWKTRYFEVKYKTSHAAFTCSKSTVKTAEAMCENFSKSRTKTSERHHSVVLLLSVNIIHTLFWCFYFRLWTNKWLLGNFEIFSSTLNWNLEQDYVIFARGHKSRLVSQILSLWN